MQSMKRVTTYDEANEAGVSRPRCPGHQRRTSSRAARSRRLKKRLKSWAKPNAIAQGLALEKTTTIALVIPEASFTYTGQIINGLLDVAKIYKYNIMLHTTTEGINEINDIIENIIKSRVDGVVIYNDKLMREELNTLTKYNVPIVIIGNKVSDSKISSVYVDIENAV